VDSFFYMVILAGAISGASTGLLGVYIIGMRMPFIGTCISHAAMAGTMFGILLGVGPTAGAIGAAVITSASLAAIKPGKAKMDTNVGLAILFTLMLGLTFLGMGLIEGSRSEVLGLLWGSILFVDSSAVIGIAIIAAVMLVFLLIFNKEMKAILFSRQMARATGIHQGFVYLLFLVLCGVVLSMNLKMIGGLMIFSLITNPAAAAYQLFKGYTTVAVGAAMLGMFTAVSGFLVSFYFDLPTGACIVVVSSLIFAAAAGIRKIRES
jgi:manganese/iron transport system permease protein